VKRTVVGAIVLAACSLAPAARAQVIVGPAYPYPYSYGYDNVSGLLRIEVDRKDAEVYIDGYYAGIVDDFDGMFQKLRLPSGGHDVTIYRDGLRAFTQHVYLAPDSTFIIKHKMEPLGPGEIAEARPIPPNPPQAAENPEQPEPPRGRIGRRAPLPPNGPFPRGGPPQPRPLPPSGPLPETAPPPNQTATGTLDISVQPADAEVLIDGQPSGGSAQFLIDVPEGEHAIQVRKQGYVGYLTSVQIRRGETLPLNISLRKQP
jgi:hypothetical protein